jgi:hypothetical protein
METKPNRALAPKPSQPDRHAPEHSRPFYPPWRAVWIDGAPRRKNRSGRDIKRVDMLKAMHRPRLRGPAGYRIDVKSVMATE